MTANVDAPAIPKSLVEVDRAFMTALLRRRGVIDATGEVVSQEERDVGMTAGYFSAIKKVYAPIGTRRTGAIHLS